MNGFRCILFLGGTDYQVHVCDGRNWVGVVEDSKFHNY